MVGDQAMNSTAPDRHPTRRLNGRSGKRLASAGLRAVAANPTAELRGARLEVAGRPIGIVVPYLACDLSTLPAAAHRGVVDGLGLRVRHSDRDLHLELSPTEPLERVVFDIAEQFRCEALAPPTWRGVRANCAAAFDHWSEAAGPGGELSERLTETGVGLVIFTIMHMLRARLLGQPTTEQIDDVIETTRGHLSKLVGHALQPLPRLIDDQAAFAVPAAEIARLLAEMIGDAEELAAIEGGEQARLLIPLDWEALDHELASAAGVQAAAGDIGDYAVFTTGHDIEVTGASLYSAVTLRRLRTDLERHRSAQAVSVARLSLRLQALFGSASIEGWRGGEDDGALDPSRLAQLIANPIEARVYRQPRIRPSAEAAVTFLIDTSGSMKVQRYEGVAVLVDTLVRALEMGGIVTEVLGFTTATWGGGRSREDWQRSGAPAEPGRVADLQYIVYKGAEQTWRQARFSMAAMMRTDHYREGVDGEAVVWAAGRLLARPEWRRVLVLISDGFPMETSTARLNRDGYLFDHLRRVWEQAGEAVEVGAITLDHDLSEIISPSVGLDLTGTLTIDTYNVLHRLFG
ncbi:MAG: cobalt chelatase [Acidimicrobiia bacterium]|nr:cobalt chelatase [Acidimicrobiia bacterium]